MKDKHLKLFWTREKSDWANIDITNRCPLMCPLCQRQRIYTENNLKVPGKDMSLEVFDTITNHFPGVDFCGQYSDPIHHPQIDKMLEMCMKKNVGASIHTASSFKPKKWYVNMFEKYPDCIWTFAIDGIPKDSNKYRINQDGEKLFDIMLEAKKYLKHTPIWQYIVFKYNENDIDTAMQIAKENKIYFQIINSRRNRMNFEHYKATKKIYA
tara:strand:- start:997 stop:1629 length:633 start_codon:yes stop_codon:yes gene_type:complete